MIRSSSILQLTNTVINITPPEKQHTTPKPDRGKGIAKDTNESPRKLVKTSTEVCLDLDAPVHFPFKINGKLYHFTNKEIQAYYELEERNQKATMEAKLLEMKKSELIKVFHEEAAKAGVDHKILASAKGG
nr:hypothetical protein [Tanacetum cinerariifolium]